MKTFLIVILFFLCSQLLSQIDGQNKINHHNILQGKLNPGSNVFEQFTDSADSFNFRKRKSEVKVNKMVLENGFQLLNITGQKWNASNWLNDVKMNYHYDVGDRLSELIMQNWDSIDWTDAFKTTSIYDGKNNVVESIGQEWDGSGWVNYWRYVYSYDANNNLIEEIFQLVDLTSEWGDTYKYEYTYDGNNILKEKLFLNWDGLEWVNWYFDKKIIYSYNGNNNLIKELYEMWDGSNWINFSRFAYGYDGNNNLIENLEQTWVDSNWDNKIQITYTYDTNSSLTEELTQSWNGSDWQTFSDDSKLTYTYDNNYNLIEELTQLWNYQNWTDDYKFVYNYTLVSGIELDKIKNITYKLSNNYPNPFNPSTNINYSIPKQGYVTLKVFDVLGREVKTLVNKQQSQGNYEVSFDASNLTSGVYFYRIQVYMLGRAGDLVETKKMILMK